VGSHRYNGIRRERISGGSLTFLFVGLHDALGNHVIRFRLLASWRARRRFSSRTLPTSCPRGLRRSSRGLPILSNKNWWLRSSSPLRWMFVVKRCGDDTLQLSRSLCASQLQFNDRRTFTLRRYRSNFVQTQIIHCRCSRKRLSDGIRNYMLNQEGVFWQIICKCRRCLPCINIRKIYYRRISSNYTCSH